MFESHDRELFGSPPGPGDGPGDGATRSSLARAGLAIPAAG